MTATIAVTNQKGGVGKTTVAINVAGALNERGHDVLLIDLDPQGHATEGLGFVEAYDDQPPHLASVLSDLDAMEAFPELVRTAHPEMDLIPSNVDAFTLESDLTGALRSRERLSVAFDALEASTAYDYVLIDCPPSLGQLTDNALLAARQVLIPALAESTSKRALEILFDQLDSIEQAYDVQIGELGLVANRVEHDGESRDTLAWFEETFEGRIPVWEIRKRVALKRAHAAGVSIFAHDETSDMEQRFLDIAGYLEDVA